jgi:hypothetical protein
LTKTIASAIPTRRMIASHGATDCLRGSRSFQVGSSTGPFTHTAPYVRPKAAVRGKGRVAR